jgi:hypothetical protein
MHMLSLSPRLSPPISLLYTSWPLFSYTSPPLYLYHSFFFLCFTFSNPICSFSFCILQFFPLFLFLSNPSCPPSLFPFFDKAFLLSIPSFLFLFSTIGLYILSLLVLNFLVVFHLPSFSPPASVSTTKLQENGGLA